MDGGLVHLVQSTTPLDFTILDADTEGVERQHIATVGDEDVYVSVQSADLISPEHLEEIHRAVENVGKVQCSDCPAMVSPDDAFYATPCGTFCDQHMEAHATECEICAKQFDLWQDPNC